jgi:putative ABC transport system permease protein
MNRSPVATIRVVTPGFFKTLRIPVLRGREFEESDPGGAASGFIVNDAFVRAYLAGLDPLAERLTVWMQAENPYLPIIGVVGDVTEGSVRDGAKPTVFYNHALMSETGMTLFARTPHPEAIATAAVSAIHRIDPKVPVTQVRTFDSAFADSLARERLNALVSGGLALSGLLLASLGVYGLLTFLVTQRTKEIAIRIALGAQASRVTRAVVGRGLRLVALGAVAGIVVSMLLLRALETLLFEVTPYDAPTYAGVLGLLVLIAVVASYIPARCAARVEPLHVLRQE